VTHAPPGGTPPGCPGGVATAAIPVTIAAAAGQFGPGSGGLFGGMHLINVLAGSDYSVDAVALDGFSQTQIWDIPGS